VSSQTFDSCGRIEIRLIPNCTYQSEVSPPTWQRTDSYLKVYERRIATLENRAYPIRLNRRWYSVPSISMQTSRHFQLIPASMKNLFKPIIRRNSLIGRWWVIWSNIPFGRSKRLVVRAPDRCPIPVGCRVGLTGVGDRPVDVELASSVDEGAGSEGTKLPFADVDLGNLDKGIVIDACSGAAEGTKSSSCDGVDGGCNLSNGTVIDDGSGTAEGTQPLFSADGSSSTSRTRHLSDRIPSWSLRARETLL